MTVINTKERSIILTAQEVNAVLAGDKTQHRVIIENTEAAQYLFNGDWRYDGRDFLNNDDCIPDPKGAHYIERLNQDGLSTEDYRCIGHCPFGAIGDRLWVQEPSLIHCDWDWFYADNTLVKCKEPFTSGDLHLPWDNEHQEYIGPVGAEHMPRWASRLVLKITDIRIERILDISDTDAKAMGLKPDYCDHKYQTCEDIGCIGIWAEPLMNYFIHEKNIANVSSHDWVWVVEFKVIKES